MSRVKCVVLCSGKGGTGKSCIAAYTGAALAKAGHKSLLVELGAGNRSLDLIVGADNEVVYTVQDAMAGRCQPAEAVLAAEIQPGLYIMPCALDGYELPEPERFEPLLAALGRDYECILVDCMDTALFPTPVADAFWLVVTPDTLSVRAATQKSRELHAAGAREVRLVINQVPAQVIPIVGVEDFDDIIDMVGAGLIGIVPHSPKLQYCSNNAEQLDSESLTVQVFDNLAARLMGQRRQLLIR